MSRSHLSGAVDRAAAARPEAPAVVCGSESLTWAELAERSDRLAAQLQANGFAPGDRLGLLLTKSVEMIVALHGAMKAGGAWVPIDPQAPAARQAFLLRDAGIRHLVTHESRRRSLERIASEEARVEFAYGLEEPSDVAAAHVPWAEVAAAGAPARLGGHDDLAYIIYTSGSTGAPKGIMHTHASSLAYCETTASLYGLTPDDRVSNQSPLHFDISIFDVLSSAMVGASTHLIPELYLKMPASFSQLLEEQRITVFFTVPFMLSLLLERGALDQRDLSALRTVIFGGEVMSPKHLREWQRRLPDTTFNNMYGPAEVNGVLSYDVPPLPDGSLEPIPIGTPFPGVKCRVHEGDEHVATGEVGELLIASGSRMRGYWARPDLDERAFWADPASDDVYYRTGDLVGRREDGVYTFLGRRDRQIKTRGYRVELDEVEAALIALPEVFEAAVFVARQGDVTDIVAHVQWEGNPSSEDDAWETHVRAELGKTIPSYAIPVRIVAVTTFPRISSGKIDYQTLQREESA